VLSEPVGRCGGVSPRHAVAVAGVGVAGKAAGAGVAEGRVAARGGRPREDVHFRILRLIERRPDATQRELAEELGVSLGAVNYCLRALIEKGHVKLDNFRSSKSKLGYAYVLTPQGIAHRAELAAGFIRRKLAEYEAIRSELEALRREYP
jgi:EPS-associated MarR family transcriptional regulator